MAKTYETLVSETRVLLQDTDADQLRYTDAVLLSILNRGLHDLSRLRPDLTYTAYANNSLNVPEIVFSGAGAGEVNWDDTFPWEMWFYNRLLEYLVAVAEISDDEYAVDGRAAMMMQLFHNGAIGI